MGFLRTFLGNHVLANITFVLILVMGWLAYSGMPRSRDPDINFNWINITTTLPGASSIEIEKRITDPLEDTISQTVKDLRFVSSTSRDNISSILVRFNQLSDEDFRERVADLRREVQNTYTDQLPIEADDPRVTEITTSSGYPTAMLALTGAATDNEFRRYAVLLQKELARLPGVDEAQLQGVEDPELHIAFYPDRLEGLGVNPDDLADTVRDYFRDVSMGDIETADGRWLVRLEGTAGSLDELEAFPIVGANGVVELGSLADIYRAAAEPTLLNRFQGQPAAMISITKQEAVNTLDLLDQINAYVADQNNIIAERGYQLTLVDDQTVSTREAINRMQQNALIGLLLVVVVTYLFLGGRIALLTTIGIPFTLAGTFLALDALGMSINNVVLLGVVIALGMLVDDAVVVVETIYYRLQRGAAAMDAAIDALREVAAPVLTSVLTTIAVFFPLMLLPGILGEYMRVIPLVVCSALAISLAEAFWMLPAHVSALGVDFSRESWRQRRRRLATQSIRHRYSLLLIWVLRRPRRSLTGVLIMGVLAVAMLAGGFVKINFFAADPLRVFYVNVEMPAGANLQQTLEHTLDAEVLVKQALKPNEARSLMVYSGQMFTATEPLFGDNVGQVFVSLNPRGADDRSTEDVIAAVEKVVGNALGDAKLSVFMLEDGPPMGQPLAVKVRGSHFADIQEVVDRLTKYMREDGNYSNINVDFHPGSPELKVSLNGDAIKRAGLTPVEVTNALQSYVDGILINQYQYLGEEVDVRLLAADGDSLDSLLSRSLVTEDGQPIQLTELVNTEYGYGYQNIRHYNFLRSVAIGADINEEELDTISANANVEAYWQTIHSDHPTVSLDFSGELDDILEAVNGIFVLFIMGLGLVYMILGTQFKSYGQPLMILVSIPLAFIGVVYGLALTRNPLSLMTMYGVVALAGIAVNSAIVLISAANSRIDSGMSPLHATIFAARRRVVPILITSTTTIAGLFSLAAGVGGKSLLWGPVATAIVSGLIFSTLLILIVIPLLFYASLTVHPWRRIRNTLRKTPTTA